MKWLTAISLTLAMLAMAVPGFAANHKIHRIGTAHIGPTTQGFYQMNAGAMSPLELRGLRVPLDIEPSHGRMLELAAYWASLSGAYLRVVSAMDHIHGLHSAHYSGDALDFQGQQLDDFAQWMRGWGFVVLWQVRGHFGHVHVQDIALWRPLAKEKSHVYVSRHLLRRATHPAISKRSPRR